MQHACSDLMNSMPIEVIFKSTLVNISSFPTLELIKQPSTDRETSISFFNRVRQYLCCRSRRVSQRRIFSIFYLQSFFTAQDLFC